MSWLGGWERQGNAGAVAGETALRTPPGYVVTRPASLTLSLPSLRPFCLRRPLLSARARSLPPLSLLWPRSRQPRPSRAALRSPEACLLPPAPPHLPAHLKSQCVISASGTGTDSFQPHIGPPPAAPEHACHKCRGAITCLSLPHLMYSKVPTSMARPQSCCPSGDSTIELWSSHYRCTLFYKSTTLGYSKLAPEACLPREWLRAMTSVRRAWPRLSQKWLHPRHPSSAVVPWPY